MVIFNSYVKLPEGSQVGKHDYNDSVWIRLNNSISMGL